jgi:diadenosine tetraphosphate (Ap4A) HIT family hydrolase
LQDENDFSAHIHAYPRYRFQDKWNGCDCDAAK